MTNDKEKSKDIGALWQKQGPKAEYMSGTITVNEQKINIVCFKNGYKKSDKHPDWRILLSTPRERVAPDSEPVTGEDQQW